jgi:glutathione S-transferase
MYKLYVIRGSHACRAAMLMLEYKKTGYRRVDIVTLMHSLVVRLHGFDADGQTRNVGGHRPLGLQMGDRLGTVPALAADSERISTNYRIARFLDDRHPDPPLFPADPGRRAAVEEAERWANDHLQMEARRIVFAGLGRDPAASSRRSGAGRLGPLLYTHELARRMVIPMIGRVVFASGRASDADLLANLSAMLDQIDTWIGQGVLGGPELNAADFMVAPSLALILYRPDVQPMFDGRPALELVDRLLPEPAQAVFQAA